MESEGLRERAFLFGGLLLLRRWHPDPPLRRLDPRRLGSSVVVRYRLREREQFLDQLLRSPRTSRSTAGTELNSGGEPGHGELRKPGRFRNADRGKDPPEPGFRQEGLDALFLLDEFFEGSAGAGLGEESQHRLARSHELSFSLASLAAMEQRDGAATAHAEQRFDRGPVQKRRSGFGLESGLDGRELVRARWVDRA